MNNRNRQVNRKIALVLALLFPFVFSYFTVYESAHMMHHCEGESCPVCHEIHIAEGFTKQLSTVAIVGGIGFMLLFCGKEHKAVISGSLSERNLIIDKVRIDS